MGIKEVKIAPASPWQNAYCERVIGSIRRVCLDHVIVMNQEHLRQTLTSYLIYYHETRTHVGLAKDCPESRTVQPMGTDDVIAIPHLGGLHHQYLRKLPDPTPVSACQRAHPKGEVPIPLARFRKIWTVTSDGISILSDDFRGNPSQCPEKSIRPIAKQLGNGAKIESDGVFGRDSRNLVLETSLPTEPCSLGGNRTSTTPSLMKYMPSA
ncbi:MAG: transposase [Magnetococcus sp. YQC-5]